MPRMMRGAMPQEVIAGPRSPVAGAGRGMVRPRLVNESEEDYVTPAMRAAMEEQKREAKDTEATGKAYERSRTTPFAKGGKVGSASKRADGIAQRGKTKGTTVVMCGGGYAKKGK